MAVLPFKETYEGFLDHFRDDDMRSGNQPFDDVSDDLAADLMVSGALDGFLEASK